MKLKGRFTIILIPLFLVFVYFFIDYNLKIHQPEYHKQVEKSHIDGILESHTCTNTWLLKVCSPNCISNNTDLEYCTKFPNITVMIINVLNSTFIVIGIWVLIAIYLHSSNTLFSKLDNLFSIGYPKDYF